MRKTDKFKRDPLKNAAASAGRRARRGRKAAIICATALMLILSFIFIMPTLLTFTNSFMSATELAANYGKIFDNLSSSSGTVFVNERMTLKFIPDSVTFSQYASVLLRNSQYLVKFWNSMILVVPIVIFQIAIASGAAYCFARFDSKWRTVVFFAYVIIMLMPYQVTLVPNYIVSEWLGLLNTRAAIILPGIFAPFSVFILTKFMRRIPKAMIEAAKLDGAGEWKIFTKICLPLCRSTLYSIAILVFIDYWNMVEQPLWLLKDTEQHPLSVFLSQVNTGDTGLAFALAAIYMVPTLLLFLYSEEYLVDGIAYSGGIKG